MFAEIMIIVIPALTLSFVLGYFFGCAVENNRRIEEESAREGWDLPPLDEPIPYRITEGFEARQELIRNTDES